MIYVALSTTYYTDPKIEAISADAERLFTRSLAYCGNAENRGRITSTALKNLGLRRVESLAQQLVDVGLWEVIDAPSDHDQGHLNSAVTDVSNAQSAPSQTRSKAHLKNTPSRAKAATIYRIVRWADWQDKGDELVKRRSSDRDRKARQRERDRAAEGRLSRDTSRDVTPTEERREEERREKEEMTSIDPLQSVWDSNRCDQPAESLPDVWDAEEENPSIDNPDEPPGSGTVSDRGQLAVVPDHSSSVVATRVEANAVVDRYQAALCPAGVVPTVRKSMVGAIRTLLADGASREHIEGGIKLWHESTMNHPSQIATFVHQFANQGNRRTGNASTKAADYLATGAAMLATQHFQSTAGHTASACPWDTEPISSESVRPRNFNRQGLG
ncbi:hypothetical protein [Rhodococcus sp. IEGM 1330]|uniref:hypothetical protein n=1 Tax=Rhodococcus sp. IEGM 1330 TaxID=3082225 RepID=UPI00295383AB|nr:hypothetical protein [Rhodococcus sp. IEGM 1330]MDV8024974.1 hypothetical protein [Rhodococcus sp. IEGM 1330]